MAKKRLFYMALPLKTHREIILRVEGILVSQGRAEQKCLCTC